MPPILSILWLKDKTNQPLKPKKFNGNWMDWSGRAAAAITAQRRKKTSNQSNQTAAQLRCLMDGCAAGAAHFSSFSLRERKKRESSPFFSNSIINFIQHFISFDEMKSVDEMRLNGAAQCRKALQFFFNFFELPILKEQFKKKLKELIGLRPASLKLNQWRWKEIPQSSISLSTPI